jgi:hypothetical protein
MIYRFIMITSGPTYTISKGKITAISATTEWPSQSGGTYTPSYIVYYKQTNQTTWIPSNEATPLVQTPVLKMEYKQRNLVPDSYYDFKVKLVIQAIKYMDAAESNVLLRVSTYSKYSLAMVALFVFIRRQCGSEMWLSVPIRHPQQARIRGRPLSFVKNI